MCKWDDIIYLQYLNRILNTLSLYIKWKMKEKQEMKTEKNLCMQIKKNYFYTWNVSSSLPTKVQCYFKYTISYCLQKKKTVVNLQVCTVTDLRVFLKLCQVYLKSQEKRNILFSSPKWNLGNVPKVVIIFQRQRLALALQITYPKQVIYNRLI